MIQTLKTLTLKTQTLYNPIPRSLLGGNAHIKIDKWIKALKGSEFDPNPNPNPNPNPTPNPNPQRRCQEVSYRPHGRQAPTALYG